MKDSMIDTMLAMMPYMKPFMWFGAAFAVIGIVLILAQLMFKSNANKGIVLSMRIVLVTAVFFLLAQAAGVYLSMSPTVNFGDSSKFEFILVSFWHIGLAFLFTALILKILGKTKQQAAT
ncbi:MAG: hypothetical protein ACC657_14860 [Thiohalomonadales bacterium]